ncbi:hypothetical protein TIFTF001_036536 [Ficus carica]|uniref:Uncharacterized protein n=1 Tax=Ficus carica TaxID=3494 RepID=A0AA88JAV6_FICCA|nr:hypothetical protein TIFTF001_036536 [Ficus carica]
MEVAEVMEDVVDEYILIPSKHWYQCEFTTRSIDRLVVSPWKPQALRFKTPRHCYGKSRKAARRATKVNAISVISKTAIVER